MVFSERVFKAKCFHFRHGWVTTDNPVERPLQLTARQITVAGIPPVISQEVELIAKAELSSIRVDAVTRVWPMDDYKGFFQQFRTT